MADSASSDGSMPPPVLPTSSTRNLNVEISKLEELQRKSSSPLRESVCKKAFSLLDEDKDGRISALDIERRRELFDKKYFDRISAIFRDIMDEFNILSFHTFVSLTAREEEDKEVDVWHKKFRNYEKDDSRGSGITAKSLQKMLSKLGEKRTTQECLNMIRMVNPSGDDVINFEDFKVLRFFSTLHKRLEYNIKKQNYRPVGNCGSTTKVNGVSDRSVPVELLPKTMV